jgi:hypothetical protein
MKGVAEDAADARMEAFLELIGARLGRPDRRPSFATYFMGLLSDAERKSLEPLAARGILDPSHADAAHQRLQHFVTDVGRSCCPLGGNSLRADRDDESVAGRGVDHRRHRASKSRATTLPEETSVSRALQTWAGEVVATPPAAPPLPSLAEERYWLTDVLNDFRDERSEAELRAVATKLYPLVCNFVLKTRGQWLGSGKTLPRLVERSAPDVSKLIEGAFATFFKTGDRTAVLQAVQKVLEPFGGELFDGFRSEAPASARVPPAEVPWTRR